MAGCEVITALPSKLSHSCLAFCKVVVYFFSALSADKRVEKGGAFLYSAFLVHRINKKQAVYFIQKLGPWVASMVGGLGLPAAY